ncbi:MAG: hypothetical protein LBT46_04060 [Planctomycetaceae bacterium]|nr:hypothetical protein [Planctomycetaceae bacterium]
MSELLRRYIQIGTDDCSLHQDVRGCPVLKGLIGPMIESGDVLRYEAPEVFEQLTRDWAKVLKKRRKRQIPSGSIKPPDGI